MKISLRTIIYFLMMPVMYILFSAIMKCSLYDIDWKFVIIITIGSFVGVILGTILNKKL